MARRMARCTNSYNLMILVLNVFLRLQLKSSSMAFISGVFVMNLVRLLHKMDKMVKPL